MSDELIQRVLKVIATSKRIPVETVTIDGEFEQMGIDSMDAVEILFALENEFDISIPDEEVRQVRNVRQMCEGVARLIAAKSAEHFEARRLFVLGVTLRKIRPEPRAYGEHDGARRRHRGRGDDDEVASAEEGEQQGDGEATGDDRGRLARADQAE